MSASAAPKRPLVACCVLMHGVGQADVVEDVVHLVGGNRLADGLLDQVAEAGGFFDAGAGLGADVQDEGAVVAVGKEVLAEEGNQQRRCSRQASRKSGDEEPACVDELLRSDSYAERTRFKAALEAALEAGEGILRERGVMVVRLEQVHGQRRHQGSRQDVGGEHGEDDGFGQRHEEVTRHAGEEEHRQEDDADAERGDERGDGDLGGAFEDGFAQVVAFFEVALDVLDGDGGVVHQDADGEREAAEGHDVDGLADEAEDDDGAEDRERDGDGDDERACARSRGRAGSSGR